MVNSLFRNIARLFRLWAVYARMDFLIVARDLKLFLIWSVSDLLMNIAGVLGLYLGYLSWEHLLWGTAAAFLLGGLYGLVLIVLRRATGKTAIPFGPFMLVGAALALLLPG